MEFMQSADTNKQAEQAERFGSTFKAETAKISEKNIKFADAARESMSAMADITGKTTENAKQIMQNNVETVSQQAREAADRFRRTLGFTGQDGERLALQSRQNVEAVTYCGTVLTQAVQDASRSWLEMSQKQWQRNLVGLNKLARAGSLQEFVAVQTELFRESLQHIVQDSRAITETSARAVEEASKAFSSMAQQTSTTAR
ncbi:phasin family protein [Methylobacterium oryzisoli]|uniref:phasin family protein n=1 Tax=Methylobacterium oryzisoli TaxID=3385502 RepID=UPI003892239C